MLSELILVAEAEDRLIRFPLQEFLGYLQDSVSEVPSEDIRRKAYGKIKCL